MPLGIRKPNYCIILLLFLITSTGWTKECHSIRNTLFKLDLIDNNHVNRFNKELPPSLVSRLTVLKTKLRPSQLSYSKLTPLKGRAIDEIEESLKNGKIVSMGTLYGKSPSNKVFVITLDDGTTAIWKPHSEVWTSNYRTEVLAYEVDRLFGFNRVPTTVERTINNQKGSLQLYKKSVDRGSLNPGEKDRMNLFDWIIDNRDRHDGSWDHLNNRWEQGPNYLVSNNGKSIYIDNGLSFMDEGEAYPFKVRKKYIDKFLETTEGKEVMAKINNTDLKTLHQQFQDYLGTKDANDAIKRLLFLKKYYAKFPK